MAIALAARNEGLAAPRARRAVRDLGGVARRRRDLRLLLAADLRQDDLGLRLGRADAGGRSRRAHGAAGLGLHPQAVAADLGHASTSPRWAPLIAIILAVPVAYCAARNTTPSVAFVRPVALFIIVSSRSINSLIWALMLVTIIGPGVFAGILAIGLRSIGFCAKLLYEAIEEIDESQVEAVRATGASGAQVTAYGIVPQVLPAFAGISVFRWDINIRESTVLGLVGAGGIGLPLNAAITTLALDAGVADSAGHHRHRGRQRMGFGQGAPRDHLRP